ncbi:uncharacterized protein LACBIDRAFT_326238 [Laccaria bicolor S238N-H82]|uniref:Predicted protein n=1 Tax=Laccaria bicolor (strain S238N-H82 / ATCC MYA-4686) TaxID=486041 RepID=B0D7R9_LACBS|nr:uncharacterized protein LACBIDRAFT_326238 [Laccaria bicolor S238N-H82]EDR09448.1 predicted protein [Laccaria bicolor S238N-H82]|eukprot:XP_001879797.1 predicted protein [Laccaria bicolor S238N-H82]
MSAHYQRATTDRDCPPPTDTDGNEHPPSSPLRRLLAAPLPPAQIDVGRAWGLAMREWSGGYNMATSAHHQYQHINNPADLLFVVIGPTTRWRMTNVMDNTTTTRDDVTGQCRCDNNPQDSYAATTQNDNNATTTPDNDDATTSRDDNHTATVQADMQPHQERGHPWTAMFIDDNGTTTTRGEGLARSKGHNNGRQPRATDNDSTMGRQYHFWLHGNLGESVFFIRHRATARGDLSSLLSATHEAVMDVARPRGNREEQEWVYANYSAIVQSSGMGKSRTVDELAKTSVVITMNLRGTKTTGCPCADDQVRDYLTMVASKNEAFDCADTFFEALFHHTFQTLQRGCQGLDYSQVANEFRKCMSEGQMMKLHNQYHTKFFDEVVREASRIRIKRGRQPQTTSAEPPLMTETSSLSQPSTPANQALKLLTDFLGMLPEGKREKEAPVLILAFDKAHIIAEWKKSSDGEQWSVFHQVQQLLRSFRHLPIFSLFLSTTGKISQFTSAAEEDPSKRIINGDLVPGQPLTDLGFDPFAHKISLNGDWDLKKLTHDEHICSMGRPLFAT